MFFLPLKLCGKAENELHEMIIARLLLSPQIPELSRCTVLMRERSRVEETLRAMHYAGAGALQVTPLFLSDYLLIRSVENSQRSLSCAHISN